MQLVVDHMLGRLARWLRAMGQDVVYSQALDDPDLARIARVEGRVLITRDRELSRQKGFRSVLVAGDHLEEQLRQVCAELGIDLEVAEPSEARCLVCNTLLDLVARESVEGEVPPYVYQTNSQFRRCPKCGRTYWPGTHRKQMRQRLADMGGE